MALETGVLVAAFSAMLCWAVADFLVQKSTRKIGNLESLAVIGIVGTVSLFPLVIRDFGLIFSASNLALILVLGVLTFVAAMFDCEALRVAKLSTVDILMEIELPITIMLGYLFFNEVLAPMQIFMVGLIFAGILLVATKSFSHWAIRWEKGVILAVIGAIGMGFINFLTSATSRAISPIMAVWAPWLILTLFCLTLIYRRGEFPRFVKNASRFRWFLLGMGIIDTAAWIFYSFAVFGESVGIVTAITESYPAVALFLGVWLNREKINGHQYLGAALAIFSSIALAVFI
ncbi:MAG: DMT family transporter [Candidatus Aenigmarchaeota archaeon]|nr:DMT family transporter [Candidatus Aenigmarchaeota archaeon]